MQFELDEFHRNVPDEELLADLRRAHDAAKQCNQSLSYRAYDELGKYSAGTIAVRFGSWNQGLTAAGLSRNETKNATEEELFLNLENIWTILGRQPKTRDLVKPVSDFTHDVYSRRFGGYREALGAFLEWVQERDPETANESAPQNMTTIQDTPIQPKRRTSRTISDRMRFRVLMRDGFSCQSCGASPQKQRGVELHVDHVVPWSLGGETVEANLQTKCSQCNLGKGNAFTQ